MYLVITIGVIVVVRLRVLRCLSGGALLLSANHLDTGQCFHTATSHGPVAGTDARFWGGGTVVSSNPQGADRARGDHAK